MEESKVKVKWCNDRLTRDIEGARARGVSISEEQIKGWRVGDIGKYGSGGGIDYCVSAARSLGKAMEALATAEAYKAHPPTLLIVVVDSYESREALKDRGYSFDRNAHWLDIVGRHTRPGWWIEIDLSTATEDRISSEIEWLRDLGCEFAETAWLDSLGQKAARSIHGTNADSIPY